MQINMEAKSFFQEERKQPGTSVLEKCKRVIIDPCKVTEREKSHISLRMVLLQAQIKQTMVHQGRRLEIMH